MFLTREPGQKICEYDFGDQNEFIHEILGMMEKSKYCRIVLAAALMKTYYDQEDTIKRELKREGEKLL